MNDSIETKDLLERIETAERQIHRLVSVGGMMFFICAASVLMSFAALLIAAIALLK